MCRNVNIFFLLTILLPLHYSLAEVLDPKDFRNAGEARGAVFKRIRLEENGVLHLHDDADGAFNNGLQRSLTKEELSGARGKYLKFSAELRQKFASALDCVGISVAARLKNSRWVTRSARTRTTGSTGWETLETGLFLPMDTVSAFLSLDCAAGYGRKAEGWFRNLKMEVSDEPVWTQSARRQEALFRFPGKVSEWSWSESPGIYLIPASNELSFLPISEKEGTVHFRPADGKPLLLSGIHGKSTLVLEMDGPYSFSMDLISYGKANRRVSRKGSGRTGESLRIPLSEFALPHDLAELNGVNITTASPLKIRRISFENLTLPKKEVNLLPDSSFEMVETLAPSYPLLGDYRTEKTMNRCFLDSGKAFHGKRSLRLDPGGFYTWMSYDQARNGAVFSFYAQTEKPNRICVMLHPLETDMHGTNAPIYRKSFLLEPGEWKREKIISPKTNREPPPQQFNFYRMEIRNEGNSPVWIDAVQLEHGTVEAGAFMGHRNSTAEVYLSPAVSPERYSGMKNRGTTKKGEVRFRVLNPAGKKVRNAIVSGGIPFPKGEVFDSSGMVLINAGGGVVPAQFTILARRPVDGSILAVKVDFLADLEAGVSRDFRLRYGETLSSPPSSGPALARQIGNGVGIRIGGRELEIVPEEKSLLKNMLLRCVVKTVDGRIHTAKPDTIEIEENGPVTSTILIRGGAELAYELRLTAFAGKPFFRLDYSFENNFIPKVTPLMKTVQAIYLELPGGRRWRADGFSGEGNGSVIQRHARSGRAEWDVFQRSGRTGTIRSGEKLSGVASSGRGVVRVENLWQNAPRGFGFEEDRMKLYLWPEDGVNPLDLPLGLAASMRLWYNPDGAELPEEKEALLQTDPTHLSRSGVFGPLRSSAELKAEFPRSWKLIDDVFSADLREAEVKNMYGYGDFGDFGSRCWTTNHETSAVRNLWTRYLRTGRYEDFEMARNHSLHQRDLDMCHGGRFAKGVYPHYTWTHINYNFHTGHFWLTGLVYHYLLTGDRRSLDAIIGAAAVLIQKSAIPYKSGRERHRMLFHLAEIYELTGNPEVKKAFERQYNLGGTSDSSGYYGGIAHEALLKLYDVTGEQKYLDRLNREAERFLSINSQPSPMPENRIQAPTLTGSADEGRGCMRLFMESVMAKRLSNSDYLNYLSRGRDSYIWSLLSPNGRDTSLEWAAFYLEGLRSFGRKEDSRLPSEYSFLHRLTGRMPFCGINEPFELLLYPDTKGVVSLDLYRIRSFRYWSFKREGDSLRLTAFDSRGNQVRSMELYENLPAEYGKFQMKSPDGKPVRVKLLFANDCWGGVSSDYPFLISASRWFSARTGIAVPIGFFLKSPVNGKLRVHWRWPRGRNTNAGESLGIVLETPEGKRVLSEVFMIPFEYQTDQENCSCSMELTLPEEYRGKILRVWMSDPKWIEWRMEGLDLPWFTDRAEFFRSVL